MRSTAMHFWRLLSLWALLWAGLAGAQDLQPVPPLSGKVIDQTATLTSGERGALERQLAALEADKGSQVVVLIVPTTQPEDIAAYANRVGNTWKIGRRDVGDGLLLVVAKNDRSVRIEVAKALEGAVPDLAARIIIDEVIVPAFRRGDFAGGLSGAVAQLGARIRGEALPPVEGAAVELNDGGRWALIGTFVLFLCPIVFIVVKDWLGERGGLLLTTGASMWVAWASSAGLVAAVMAGLSAFTLMTLFGAALRRLNNPTRSASAAGAGYHAESGSNDEGSSSSDSPSPSSGGGGDFGGGGATGKW